MHTEPTPPAFIEGIHDPEGWSDFCRTTDLLAKNALKRLAPKYSASVSLNYLDGLQSRQILSFTANTPDDATDLAALFASLPPPHNRRRMIIVNPSNAFAYEY